ncbi:hypothetical protein KP509_04G025800 [Ceratopteris richardii]|uniref:D-isomer specific 2-hydroxyacid dehydrogenase NAD-binding domain-containing protein n=1 Tax=Ceratopteris richardii TaxID=49495 RepID=A0A8T2UTM7_CERRI|nr:hypothetical protein KP509_04G025800 [Ceratopteris richardii]KAH7438673.1 hypothetical protein KP509_04G025800 [Ceratopteris richardii]KAH7438674.1 hypothetical protein KP509_04G025800 [Ceratopteris richardii]
MTKIEPTARKPVEAGHQLGPSDRGTPPHGSRKENEKIRATPPIICEPPVSLPLIVALNCLEDCHLEEEALSGVAQIQHVGLQHVTEGKIEAALAVLLHSLSFLPRAAQRRLQPSQLILCLGSVEKTADSSLASELGLHLLHVDTGRAEEVADTVMALVLGLLRHTHALAGRGLSNLGGWLGAIQPVCRGMRRCRGLIMGIIGRSASACALASRTLAFKMKVIYFEVEEGKDGILHGRMNFPAAAKKVETLKELLAASDIVSLQCSLTTDTLQLINADALQHIKPGALVVNTSSNHLLDDCALKQALIDGTVAGCALDGAEGPQWMEAWVREMPNVLILPKSADYSEEVWMEIRAKAVTILRSFLLDGVIPSSAVSDEDDDDYIWQEEKQDKQEKDPLMWSSEQKNLLADGQSLQDHRHKQMYFNTPDPRLQDGVTQQVSQRERSHCKGAGRKGKKRPGRRKSQRGADVLTTEREANWVALQRDDLGASISGRDQVLSSSSRFASPEDSKCKREELITEEATSERRSSLGLYNGLYQQAIDFLKEGYVIALRVTDGSGYHVARQRGPGRGWCLDTISDVTIRDPATQFLVVLRNHERVGLRSLAAGGKLLQANKKLELVFVNHTFDIWESWILEGSALAECRLTNSKFCTVSLNVAMEILAVIGEEDGVARWLS